jgi:signal transduction histidine kinase
MPDKYSEVLILIITTTCLLLLLGGIIIGFILLFRSRQQKYFRDTQTLQSQFDQTLLQSQLEIQEQTLQNISQEIHDNIGQVLSLTKLNLGTMDIDKPDQLQQKIEDSKKLIGKAIQDLRDLSKSLSTDYVSAMGLTEAINYELEMIRKSGVYTTTLETEGSPIKLEAQKELIIFRIVQEIINNIIKHAKATTIIIQLNYGPEAFSIIVNDNGSGFDLTPLNAGDNSKFGLGLRNMYKRARLIGAQFSITSTLGAGTTVTLILPHDPNHVVSA